jgi:hypothetical protein
VPVEVVVATLVYGGKHKVGADLHLAWALSVQFEPHDLRVVE